MKMFVDSMRPDPTQSTKTAAVWGWRWAEAGMLLVCGPMQWRSSQGATAESVGQPEMRRRRF